MPREAELGEAKSHAHGNAAVAKMGFELGILLPVASAPYSVGSVAEA